MHGAGISLAAKIEICDSIAAEFAGVGKGGWGSNVPSRICHRAVA
jgi:hypothetical protein